MGAVLKILAALPTLYSMFKDVAKFFEDMFGPNWPAELVRNAQVFKELRLADTPEKKQIVAGKIADMWHSAKRPK